VVGEFSPGGATGVEVASGGAVLVAEVDGVVLGELDGVTLGDGVDVGVDVGVTLGVGFGEWDFPGAGDLSAADDGHVVLGVGAAEAPVLAVLPPGPDECDFPEWPAAPGELLEAGRPGLPVFW
jgi:hypothetical protein